MGFGAAIGFPWAGGVSVGFIYGVGATSGVDLHFRVFTRTFYCCTVHGFGAGDLARGVIIK